MYSEKLKKEKISCQNERLTVGIEIEEKTIIERINLFCKKDDLIGVQPSKVFELFDEFCEENHFERLTQNSFGKVLRKHFNLERKKARNGKTLVWVYVSVI